jgi:hypothetical protein
MDRDEIERERARERREESRGEDRRNDGIFSLERFPTLLAMVVFIKETMIR